MIDIEHDRATCQCRIVVRPNQSISWTATCCFFLSLLLVSGVIALWLSLMGYWPVLPLAGIELTAVAIGLYVVARRGQQKEVISLTGENIRIERGRHRPEQVVTMLRIWARVVLERCPKRWYPSRLLIRSHGHAVEIGRFLNEDERRRLAVELVKCLSAVPSPRTPPAGQHVSES